MLEIRLRCTVNSSLSSFVQRCALRGFIRSGIRPLTVEILSLTYRCSRTVTSRIDLTNVTGQAAMCLRAGMGRSNYSIPAVHPLARVRQFRGSKPVQHRAGIVLDNQHRAVLHPQEALLHCMIEKGSEPSEIPVY